MFQMVMEGSPSNRLSNPLLRLQTVMGGSPNNRSNPSIFLYFVRNTFNGIVFVSRLALT